MLYIRQARDREAVASFAATNLDELQASLCRTTEDLYRAELDGTLVGYIGLIQNDLRAEGGVWITCMGVHPNYQGQGIGKTLLAFATKLSATGFTAGDVQRSNQTARNFFHAQHEGVESYNGDPLPPPPDAGNSQYVDDPNVPQPDTILRGKPRV